jgi:hypothetical protein
MKEVSEALKPWEIQGSTSRQGTTVKVVTLSLLLSLSSFALGLFSFTVEYGITCRGQALSILAGSISNLVWGVVILLAIRWFTPEPYLRIAFYSFLSPTLLFGVYAVGAFLLSSHSG